MIRTKAGAATLSIVSNSVLIALKLAAGAITGSIAIITEALHSGIDLIASVIAFSAVANVVVSAFLRRRARELHSPALAGDAAHLGTDALTSVGVLVGLLLVEITDEPAFDAIAALCVAVAIVVAGIRILTRSSRDLVDEAPPSAELDRIEATIARQREAAPEIAGYHKLRARRSGARTHVDMHLQFRSGTTLERAHVLAHRLRDAIEGELPRSEVLIHLEPEGSVRDPGTLAGDPGRAG